MPTYVYGCDACGHQFEKFQKFADEPVRTCPECQSPVRRIFQPAGIVFKGSGWHVTDYKRSGGNDQEAANGETKSAKDGETKTEAKSSDTKSDAKTESASTTTSDSATPAKAASS